MRQARKTRRLAIALLSVSALLISLLSTATTAAAGTAPPAGKIEPKLLAALQDGSADLWIRLAENANTAPARAVRDRTARGERVVDALRGTARESQARLRRVLDAHGADYQPFWITNAILVRDASRELALEVAGMDGVVRLRAPREYRQIRPVPQPAGIAPAATEWGISNINADDVWAEGVRGAGIVVANIDTGVQFDHPALVGSYRGNNGDGTFSHDYNWFDAENACGGQPCDRNGHGTHTMGTMVGDDGADHQIGVAPGAKWIAASGCCPSEATLLAASQWILAPTDSNGENPDASRRPHIVNNSWGTTEPTNDPFLEDIQRAWADSGIFGVWSNGNLGERGCQSSGSPGSRSLNYSVGAYDSNNAIAYFSSRGPGQDGEIKPNISAPGVSVLSSVPDSQYRAISGTSMAAPHVSGAIALLWSARPELARDIQSTRTLLDLSAVDTAGDQCGGTPEDNNVYGEGRLDALALLRLGEAGLATLTGTVTDADTGAPVEGAEVSVAGPVERAVRTGADGGYTLPVVAGDYQVAVRGVFGYQDAVANVTVTAGAPSTHDVALVPTPRVTVSGVVTDGSGQGWPLAAKVVAATAAGAEAVTHTDPDTGAYQLPVVPNTSYTLRVTAEVPGYQPVRRRLDVGGSDLVVDVALTVDPSCTAAGYQPGYEGVTESFDRRWSRWRVHNADLDYPGYRDWRGWTLRNPGDRTNNTGGDGGFAIVDSDHYGQHSVQDTTLTSPVFDMSGYDTPAVEFATDLLPAVNSTATVELSTDGGRTWATVWRDAGFPGVRGPANVVVQLPDAAGKPEVALRLHYTGQWSGWWQVDNVFAGNRTCDPMP